METGEGRLLIPRLQGFDANLVVASVTRRPIKCHRVDLGDAAGWVGIPLARTRARWQHPCSSLHLCSSLHPHSSLHPPASHLFPYWGRERGQTQRPGDNPQTVSQFGELGNRRGEGSPWDPRASPRRCPPVAWGLRAHEGARSRAEPAVRGTAPALAFSLSSQRYFLFFSTP